MYDTLYLDDEEATATEDGHLLSNNLVRDVSEVGFDDVGLGSLYEPKATDRKSKSSLTRSECTNLKLFLNE
jgi:hypothetical protein